MDKPKFVKSKWMTFSALVLTTFLLQAQKAEANEQGETVTSAVEEIVDVIPSAPVVETVSTNVTTPAVEIGEETTNTNLNSISEASSTVEENSSESVTSESTTTPVVSTSDLSSVEKMTAEKLSTESNAIVNVAPMWNNDVKGEGTVVAIIDSGLDVEHDAFHLTDISKAKYQSEAEIEAKKAEAGITYGKWYNDKVIFGYNYADVNEELKEADSESHGTHVSGISTGNPTQKDSSGDFIRGVAPEAQLMFMRVFSDSTPGTSGFLYVRAIQDAVKLGADVINLSLGSATGALHDAGRRLDEAIEQARQAGVTVVIAAGNDTVFGEGYALPDADKPDYGLVANPSVAQGAISVASYNNTHVTSEVATVVGLEKNADFNYGKVSFTRPSDGKAEFSKDTSYDYEFVGLGKADDFAGKDLTGKVALIKRGEITFAEKLKNAKNSNAAGVVVFNNTPGALLTMQLSDPFAVRVPAIFIGQDIGEELAKESGTSKYKIRVDGTYLLSPNPDAGKMSDFSSWGLSTDGELKPDVSAPGGSIYSSVNDGKYVTQSGTSMASPHVTGVVALVKQYFETRFPELKGDELQDLIKHVLMSTANPHYNQESKAYTSPRQQGAGIVDTAKASHADLYVTGDDDYGSISLGNVGDQLSFNVTLHNISDREYKLRYVTNLNTDSVADGKITLLPRQLSAVEGSEVIVPAKGKLVVPIQVDASAFAKELSASMTNGYYLEGFVRFLDVVDGVEAVSIPFVGFRGNFQDLPVMEKPIYDFKDGESPFYFDIPEDGNLAQTEDSDYTALFTTESEWDHIAGDYTVGLPITFGTFEDNQGRYIYKLDENGKPYFAISPNGDGNRDSLAVRAVFLRNYENLKVGVYRADDNAYQAPLWESKEDYGRKNYYSGREENLKSVILENSAWEGKDANGNVLPDGDYVYRISYYSAVPGATEQSATFAFTVDTVAPAITSGVIDEEKGTFKPRPSIENETGIYRERLYYVLEPLHDENGNIIEDTEDYGDKVSSTRRVYVERQADGTYILPKTDLRGNELDLSFFYYVVEDHAGNTLSANLVDFAALGNESGIVNIRLVDKETGTPLEGLGYRYMIRDSEGNLVHEATQASEGLHTMPFGDYTVELLLLEEEYATLVGPRTISFSVTEDNTLQAVDFLVDFVNYAVFRLSFDGALPDGAGVYVVDENGNREMLSPAKYASNVYEKKLVIDPYTVVIELPRAYQVSENNFSFNVLDGRNVKYLHLTAKGDLTKDGAALEQPELPVFDLAADSDNDGFSNEFELSHQSNPLDAASVPWVTSKGEPIILEALPEAEVPVITTKGEPVILDALPEAEVPMITTKGEPVILDALPEAEVPVMTSKGEPVILDELPTITMLSTNETGSITKEEPVKSLSYYSSKEDDSLPNTGDEQTTVVTILMGMMFIGLGIVGIKRNRHMN